MDLSNRTVIPEDFRHLPFEEGEPIDIKFDLSPEEFSRLKQGHAADEFLETWFIYYTEPFLHLILARRGWPAFRIKFEEQSSRFVSVEVLKTAYCKKIVWMDDPVREVKIVIDYVLLGKPYPE